MAHADSERQYHVALADITRDKAVILKLWAHGFPQLSESTATRKIENQYLENPAGAGVCFALCTNNTDTYIGIQGLVPRQFTDHDATLHAGLMADYVVDSAHRSIGPALQLLKGCVAGGVQKFDFLYGFPNAKAQAIFKRAGLAANGQMTQYVKLLRSRNFLEKKIRVRWAAPVIAAVTDVALGLVHGLRYLAQKNKYQWRELTSFDSSFNTLWQQPSMPKFLSTRSDAILTWRYSTPSDKYKIFAAFTHDSNLLAGYIVWSEHERDIIVHDFLAASPALQPLLQCFCWRMWQCSATRVGLEFFGAAQIKRTLVQAGFIPRGGNPVFMLGSPRFPPEERESWYLTGFDRDTD